MSLSIVKPVKFPFFNLEMSGCFAPIKSAACF